MEINCMSLAVWLEEERKCSAVVGLDLVLELSQPTLNLVPRVSLLPAKGRRETLGTRLELSVV